MKLTDDERRNRTAQMKAAYESGCTTTEVGAQFGLHHSQVSRVLRAAGTTMRPFGGSGTAHPGWGGDSITYSGAHMRVRAVRGSARAHQCSCGRPAAQWAYRHDDPDERTATEGAYSTDPVRYDPMCVSCHKRFDLGRLS